MIVSTKWIQKRVIIPHLIILGLSFYVLNVLATQSHRIKGGRVELESSERSSSSILLPISNRRRVTKESEKETKVEKDKEKGLPKKRDCKLSKFHVFV